MAQALADRRQRLGGDSGVGGVSQPLGSTTARRTISQQFQSILDEAKTRAALSGSFSPDALFVGDVDEETRQRVLSQLVPNVVTESPGQRWTLLNAPRAEILQGVLARQEIAEKLAGALPDTDSFGHTLRDVLRKGDSIDLPEQIPELLDLSKAIEAIGSLDVPKPDLNQLRQKLERASFLKDFDTLLGRGVIGRDQESADLHSWLTTSSAAPWDGLMLSGLGGAGKSTLLVSFLQSVVRNQQAVVALLDFDRPGVDATDTSWMEFEISRQVGYQYPDIADQLRDVRRSLREENQRPAQNADIEQASFGRTSRQLMMQMRIKLMQNAVTPATPPSTPFVLALDTLETVVERGLQGKIIDWLYSLQDSLFPFRLKVIFSGRMFEASDPMFQPVVQTRMMLGELPAPDAQLLLERFDVESSIASRIAGSDVLPRRPLELRLLAKLIHQDELDSRTTDIDQLERELREGGPAAQSLFAGLVYRRVLERLPENSRARELAYPGLVLRYLTAEILVEVLAPALGLGDLTLTTAQEALDELARHDWLVYRKDEQLWHRSELRRSTLVPMLSSSDAKVREIRRSAIAFFERVPPSGTSLPEHLGEAIYHRLMDAKPADDAGRFDLDAIKRLQYVFEQSIAELPPSGTALLKLARGDLLTVEGIHSLPGGFRPAAADGTGLRLVADRQLGQAYALHDHSRQSSWSAATWQFSPRSLSWRCEAAFGTAHWADLIQNLPPPPRDEHELESLGRLYPYELAAPADVPAREVADWLASDRTLLERPGRSLRPGTSDRVMRRIAIVTALVNARDSFDARERRVLFDLVNLFIKQRKGEVDDPSLTWLAGIARARKSYRMVLRTFNLCLDRTWLETFSEHARRLEASRDADKLAANIWSYMNAQSALGARKLLGDIDLLDSGKSRAYLEIEANDGESLWWLLRGPSPELRNPARYALLESFRTRGQHAKLAEILQRHVDIELLELQPGHFADAMHVNREETLATYVELVDRHWRLPEFLDACVEAAPGETLEAVRDASHRWEAGIRIALLGANAGLSAT